MSYHVLDINDNVIGYLTNSSMTSEYYLYCVKLIYDYLKCKDVNLNLNFLFDEIRSLEVFGNNKKIVTLVIQCEHTLVKKGGRSLENAPLGKILDDDGEPYHVRLASADYLSNFDIIIEYSYLNMINLKASELFDKYLNKMLHISPIIYDFTKIKDIYGDNRPINVLTTFINPSEPRRAKLLNNMKDSGIDFQNINNCFEKSIENILDEVDIMQKNIIQLYIKSKILVNIHQTDHHHTFEELRVLPALATGIIVISENVPIKESIPYHKYVVWTSMDSMVMTILDVINKYDIYRENYSIRSEGLQNILRDIHGENTERISDFLSPQNLIHF